MPPPGDAMEDWQILVEPRRGARRAVRLHERRRGPRDIAARVRRRHGARQALPALAFGQPMPAQHWLQASNPSERWKWDFMFQDLPPVKGIGRSVVAAAAARRDSAQRSEVSQDSARRVAAQRSPATRPCWRALAAVALAASRAGRSSARASGRRSRRSSKRDGVRAGRHRSRSRCRSTLPEGFHVQSNKPRDPTLIPTDADDRRAAGRHGRRDRLSGGDRPEAGRRRTSRSPSSSASSRSASRSTVAAERRRRRPRRARRICAIRPATRRLCFAPTTADVEWTLHVVPPATRPRAAARRRLRDDRVRPRRGAAGAGAPRRRARRLPARRRRAGADDDLAALDGFTVAGHDRRLPRNAASS